MLEGKTVLAIIPARGGSKGVPRKNIKEICGKPLIAYTIKEAKKSKIIDRIVVTTDDTEIADISRKYGSEVPFLRPKELAGDNSTTNDAILHSIKWLKENENYCPDYICLLQCTSPLRSFKDIDGALNKLADTGMDACVSICEAKTNPFWSSILIDDKLSYFMPEGKSITRRQELPKVYEYNGAIYAIKTSEFLKYKSFEPDNTTGYVMGEENSIDVDTLLDFKIAEFLINEREK